MLDHLFVFNIATIHRLMFYRMRKYIHFGLFREKKSINLRNRGHRGTPGRIFAACIACKCFLHFCFLANENQQPGSVPRPGYRVRNVDRSKCNGICRLQFASAITQCLRRISREILPPACPLLTRLTHATSDTYRPAPWPATFPVSVGASVGALARHRSRSGGPVCLARCT